MPSNSRATLAERIIAQEMKLRKVENKIGQLMAVRADEEEKLAKLYRQRDRLESG